MTCVLIAGLVAALGVQSNASAATTVTIRGGGWGHGIGMSQYGAYGRAVNGKSAPAIVEHYYTGANVQQAAMPEKIRVGLLQGRGAIAFTSQVFGSGSGQLAVKVSGSTEALARGDAGTTWRIEASSTGGMRLYKNNSKVTRNGNSVFGGPSKPLVAVFERFGSLLDPADKAYNYAYGRAEIGSYATSSCSAGYCLRLVLSLPMQKYLYGLGEVPSSWPGAALRAQAIAGRTYAHEKAVRLGQHRDPCDCAVYDSTIDQAYIGDAKRTGSAQYWPNWKAAVDDTRKQVLLYAGAPIQALYSSSSGGHTEHNENVWGGTPLPYLRGVSDGPDAVDANPNHTWRVKMSWSDFETKLDRAFGIGTLKDFKLVRPFGVSGRVTVVKPDGGGARIEGSQRTVRKSGWDIRSALALRDTLFRVNINYDVGSQFAQRHRRLEGAPGDPTITPYSVPRGWDKPLGKAQDFDKGRMTYRKATDNVVWQWGRVLRRYDQMGREKGPLGMPSSDIWGPGRFLGATYAKGSIYYSKETGARAVRGAFRDAYRRNDGPTGPLKLPINERQFRDTLPKKGKRQRFEAGTIYQAPNARRAYALWGRIEAKYRKMGEASGRCGYPKSDLVVDEYGQRATFQHGIILWTAHGGIEIDCTPV